MTTESSSQLSARARLLDRFVVASLTLAAGFLGARSLLGRGTAPFGGVRVAAVFYLALVIVGWVAYYASGQRRVGQRWGGRSVLFLLALMLTVSAASRLPRALRGHDPWPPVQRDLSASLRELSDAERARWVARLMAHALTAGRAETSSGVLPSDWPVPDGVTSSTQTLGDTVVVSAAVNGGTVCTAKLVAGGLVESTIDANPVQCGQSSGSLVSRWTPPRRVTLERSDQSDHNVGPARGSWLQFRRTGRRDGIADTEVANKELANSAGWISAIGGEVRSSVSIAGDAVFAGTHGNGSLVRIDLQSGQIAWRVTLPNWVHSDPVTDGSIVAVGFGDSGPAFDARSPGGVAAYAVAGGSLLWTRFEANAVMTSPIIAGNEIAYVTAGGDVRVLNLTTGASLRTTHLLGAVPMGSPALVGDKLVIGLDFDLVCVVRFADMRNDWCTHLPDARFEGHSSPAVFGDTVVIGGVTPISLFKIVPQLRAMGLRSAARLAWDVALARNSAAFGQRAVALRLSDGTVIWRGSVHLTRRAVEGHMAGTAVESKGLGVVVLPRADQVVAFDMSTGVDHWTAPAAGARAAPLIANDRVYIFAPTGTLRALDLFTGALHCEFHSPFSFDRAGPALGGGLLIAGSHSGEVVAIPRQLLDRCDHAGFARFLDSAKSGRR